MTHFFRHNAVCLWLTLLVGGMGGLWVLPALQPVVGIDLMPLVAAGGLAAMFLFIAWAVNRAGLRRVGHLMRSADVAEREGLSVEAEAAFREALAALDGFWLAPAARRQVLTRLAGRLARFYLARTRLDPAAEDFVTRYLSARPEDEEVAEQWVRQAEGRGGLREEHQELAARLGSAHPRNAAIQEAQARLFLMLERTDYPALRSYRRVCDAQGRAPDEFCEGLARLLKKDGRSDEWAQRIYSRARGEGPATDLPAVPRPREADRFPADLSEAVESDAGLPAEEEAEPEAAFRMSAAADASDEEGPDDRESLLAGRRQVRPHLRRLAQAAGSTAKAALERLFRLGRGTGRAARFAFQVRGVRYALGVLLVAGVAGGGLWLGIDALDRFDRGPSVPTGPETSAPAAAAATDPFTLQVAAYLKQEYAIKLVEELKRKGLDAYWTETSSGGKLWYQVRISHFPDQQSAREYGRNLKWKGLIDDFYVTSYAR
jgi:hypothetical protein